MRRRSLQPRRRKLPDERQAITHKFSIAGHEGYITVGLYEDGSAGRGVPEDGEGGLDHLGPDGHGRDHDLDRAPVRRPAQGLVDKFSHTRFEPSGFTQEQGDPDSPSR